MSGSCSRGGTRKAGGRNLPSWMSSTDGGGSHEKKRDDVGADKESSSGEAAKQVKGKSKADKRSLASEESKSSETTAESSLGTMNFSKLLEGVVFVLSGFVNPERSTLRSCALEMGAEYQPDWNSDCTLLVCAFQNTPKFRQVEADCGTIVSKEWITECYNQKKLVDIESYRMHVGKPWRKSDVSHENTHGPVTSPPKKPKKHIGGLHAKSAVVASSKGGTPKSAKEYFSPSEVKKWAAEDLNKTITWLDSQAEKPEQSEMRKVAVGGILACLQDAIDSLEQKQDINQMSEAWMFIPRVVEELARLDNDKSSSAPDSKELVLKQAVACKQVYEVELSHLSDDSSLMKRKLKVSDATYNSDNSRGNLEMNDVTYDSDETIPMTEEEIDLAYNAVTSSIHR